MLAYLGKDRQDAILAGIIEPDYQFKTELIGTENAKIINNLTVDIIEHSYGKDYIMLSDTAFKDLSTAKKENYEVIYNNDVMNQQYEEIIKPMFEELYYKLLDDVKRNDTDSIIFKHHINPIGNALKQYHGIDYSKEEKNQIVVDYIASMTDDYFIDLHKHMFPDSKYKIEYEPYF